MNNTRHNNTLTYNTYGYKEMTIPRNTYTYSEWRDRENEYVFSVTSIILPVEMGPDDLIVLNSIIDQVSTIAKIEEANIHQSFEYYKIQLKNMETEYFANAKLNLHQNSAGRVTEAEIKSHIITMLKSTPFPNHKDNIYDLFHSFQTRYIFMQSIVNLLSDKASKLITNSAGMKLITPPIYNQQQVYSNQPNSTYQ